jgi:hypothetical protein
MKDLHVLNRLEHNILSLLTDDSKPLFIIYTDTIKDIEGSNLDLILQALVKLVEVGYSISTQKKWGKWRPCLDISTEKLKRQFIGQSQKKKKSYPKCISGYYFEITEMGSIEEAKAMYEKYYEE